MRMSVTEAKAQLTDLVRRARAGEEVILTRHGDAAVRLVPVEAPVDMERRRKVLAKYAQTGATQTGETQAAPGPSAARSQDFLYDDDGLPG